MGAGLVGGEQTDLVVVETQLVVVGYLGGLTPGLGAVAGPADDAALVVAAVDPLCGSDPADLVDAVEDGAGQAQGRGQVGQGCVLLDASG